ncbi:hypothetical protein LOAG_02324 [Loa loa]|uniref:SHSP domain-containing protein n=1 Tax=Loa loa TaxID=7209 RepID=A0A1S0U6V9_LOALO|nr:hypothetical protein LOAG_02324 [Loa loa]EFO26166.1 hypothetical protein LOAG_02324 [Loa loa]
MVWQTFIYPKSTNSDGNWASSLSPASLSPLLPLTPITITTSSTTTTTATATTTTAATTTTTTTTTMTTAATTTTTTTTTTTATTTTKASSTTNHTQQPCNSKSSSNERSPSPRPPPRFHRPTPRSSSGSYSHHTDNNSSGYSTLHNDLPFSMTPAGRFFTHFFDEAMQYFNYPMHDIVWSDEPPTANGYNGNSINEKIIDNDEKFSIEIDLSDFLAGELLVSYDEDGRELLIKGHQKERNGRLGSVERNFERKFDIPIDTHDGSLAAYLMPSGLLTIQAFKKGNKQPIRRIPIQEVVDIPNSSDKSAADVPDPTDKNAANVPTFNTSKNTPNKIKISPPVPPKPKNVSKLTTPTIEKMSEITEEIPKIQKLKENNAEHLNFDTIQKPTRESTVKREYLNIFC